MKKHLLIALLGLTTISGAHAQLVMAYQTGFDNAGQQAGWTQYRNGVVSQFQEWDFENATAFSAPTSLVHYYPVGGADVMDDWFVSPPFTIPAGGSLDSLRYYFSGFGTPQAGDTVFVYLLNGNADPDLATSATILMEFDGADYQNDNTWRVLSPITLPVQSGNSYIAFRYKTINNWLDVRFDNLSVSRVSGAGIEEGNTQAATLYPNPLNGGQVFVQLNQESGEPLVLEVFNTAGQLIHTAVVSNGTAVDLPVAAGCYTYELKTAAAVPAGTGRLVVL